MSYGGGRGWNPFFRILSFNVLFLIYRKRPIRAGGRGVILAGGRGPPILGGGGTPRLWGGGTPRFWGGVAIGRTQLGAVCLAVDVQLIIGGLASVFRVILLVAKYEPLRFEAAQRGHEAILGHASAS